MELLVRVRIPVGTPAVIKFSNPRQNGMRNILLTQKYVVAILFFIITASFASLFLIDSYVYGERGAHLGQEISIAARAD